MQIYLIYICYNDLFKKKYCPVINYGIVFTNRSSLPIQVYLINEKKYNLKLIIFFLDLN